MPLRDLLTIRCASRQLSPAVVPIAAARRIGMRVRSLRHATATATTPRRPFVRPMGVPPTTAPTTHLTLIHSRELA